MATSHEAPGRLELVRTFINTLDLEADADPLRGPDDLEEWCRESGLPCAGEISAEPLRRLREFREALRETVWANAGEAEPQASWAALEPFAQESRFKMSISEAGVPALRPVGEGVGASIAALLAIVYDAVAGGLWPRLKACRQHTCRFAFYDRSRNGSGAWCSMAVCGNRNKARRRRARARSAL